MADGSAGHGGIYDDFPGFRLPPDQELDEALQAALVVIDANVLLNLYRYNESTRDDLLGVLQKVGDRLWVPHQVMKEFWRNRVGVLASALAITFTGRLTGRGEASTLDREMDRVAGGGMAEPVRARRLTDQEGQRLQQIVRRGKHESVRVRRAVIIMASASGTLVPAIARLVAAERPSTDPCDRITALTVHFPRFRLRR